MKVSNVLNLALKLLDINDLDLTGENYSSDKRYIKLLSAVGMIQSQIASDYFPVVSTFTQTKPFSVLNYALFPNRPIKIVKVLDEDGNKVPFEETENTIVMKNSAKYNIYYNYMPVAPQELDDDIVCDKIVSDRTFALGVASLYAAMNGLFEEAVTYDEKFLISLKISEKKPKNSFVKENRWI